MKEVVILAFIIGFLGGVSIGMMTKANAYCQKIADNYECLVEK